MGHSSCCPRWVSSRAFRPQQRPRVGVLAGATMRGMIKRWLRRRLDLHATNPETSLDDDDRERGALVRKGRLVSLRTHVPANREAFQRWYADREIAELLRHDLEPLTPTQSRGYFETFILPSSARGTCFAIHERKSKRLVGTTALTDRVNGRNGVSALFRIVIGEKDVWGRGYGTEATRLMAEEAFDSMGLSEIRLEVFNHNLTGDRSLFKSRLRSHRRTCGVGAAPQDRAPRHRDAFITGCVLGQRRRRCRRLATHEQGGARSSGAATAAERAQRSSCEAKRRNARSAEDGSVQMVTALRRYRQRSLLTPIDRRHWPPYHRRGREPVAGDTGAATWEARSDGAARGWDAIGGGVGTRDRERAARRGFAARIGFGSARGWGRRTDRGSARAAIGSVPNVVRGIAADQWFRGEMNTI